MGADKAHLEVAGVPAATRAAQLLDSLFEEVLLVGGRPPSDAPGRAVVDPPGPSCALRGLVAALDSAGATRVLVLATDLPFVAADLLLGLVAWPDADAVVPRQGGRFHPLCALYRRQVTLERARARLAARELALHGLLEELDIEPFEGPDLEALDPRGEQLWNANTPADWQRIRERLRRG